MFKDGEGIPGSPKRSEGALTTPGYPLSIQSWVLALEFDPASKSMTAQFPGIPVEQVPSSAPRATRKTWELVNPDARQAATAGLAEHRAMGRRPETPVAAPSDTDADEETGVESRCRSPAKNVETGAVTSTSTVPLAEVPELAHVTSPFSVFAVATSVTTWAQGA
jgi:hypothetical protein